MIEYTSQVDQNKQQIKDLLQREAVDWRLVKIPRHSHVFTCGDRDSMVYLIESGQIKLLSPSPEGKECLIAIYTSGDIFGELCLCGQTMRLCTAVAMKDSVLRQIPCSSLTAVLRRQSAAGALVQYLVARLAEQEQVISSLLTVNSEQRLGLTLLRLAKRLGKQDPRSVRIDQKISQEELAEMVGTTRTRIGVFLKKFRAHGLIELSAERHLIIKEASLREYLNHMAFAEDEDIEREDTRFQRQGLPRPLNSPRRGSDVRPSNEVEDRYPLRLAKAPSEDS